MYDEMVVLLVREACGLAASREAGVMRPSTPHMKVHIASSLLQFEAQFCRSFGELKRQANKAANTAAFVDLCMGAVPCAVPSVRDAAAPLGKRSGGSSQDVKVELEKPETMKAVYDQCRAKKVIMSENAMAEWAVMAIAWSNARGLASNCTPFDKCARCRTFCTGRPALARVDRLPLPQSTPISHRPTSPWRPPPPHSLCRASSQRGPL